MRINFVLPGLGIAGGVRVVFEHANRLSKRGHEVNIIYPTVPPRMGEQWFSPRSRALQILGTGRRLVMSNDVDWFDIKVPVRQIPTLSPNLMELCEPLIPDSDITIATSWETAYAVAALDDSKGVKAYFVQHYEVWQLWNNIDCWEKASESHSDPSIGMADIDPDDSKLRHMKELVDETYSLPLKLITTSDWERDVMNKLGEQVVGGVHCGVDFNEFYPTHNSTTEPLTLLSLYRNERHKGDREALQAFSTIHKKSDRVELLMFGKTRSDEVPEFIEFHEHPSQDRIRQLYSRADVFIYPSWVEGYGMPPMEAMACKTAIISTAVGAVPEYTPQDAVELIPIRDPGAIVEKVTELLNDRDKVRSMKEESFDYIQQYTWNSATEQFEQRLVDISHH
jgi:glycosyltransferase involved in cell wall biosynthesis